MPLASQNPERFSAKGLLYIDRSLFHSPTTAKLRVREFTLMHNAVALSPTSPYIVHQ